MKKIIGYILIGLFIAVCIGCFINRIAVEGWRFILIMLLILVFFAIPILGIYLINKK
jgi:hypothetical protein